MQRIQGNQRPLIEDNPNNRQQPAVAVPERPYLRFVGWQMVGLLAAGTAVGVASGVQCYRNTSQRLNDQEATINELQRRLESLEIEPLSTRSVVSLQKEQLIHKQDISELKKQQRRTTLYLHHKLTTAVALGKQEQAEAIIQQNPELLLMAGDVTDCGGRQFKQITPLQYAVWALDWHMWKMIQQYMPQEEIRKQLEQLERGMWVQEHGTKVSWQNLIDALQHYVTKGNSDVSSSDTYATIDYWKNQVGNAQRLLPAHVIQEYLRRDRSFMPVPNFTETSFPRQDVKIWFRPLNNRPGVGIGALGIDTAWSRTSWVGARSADWADVNCNNNKCAVLPASVDLIALSKLLQIRTEQREQLILSIFQKSKPRFTY